MATFANGVEHRGLKEKWDVAANKAGLQSSSEEGREKRRESGMGHYAHGQLRKRTDPAGEDLGEAVVVQVRNKQ